MPCLSPGLLQASLLVRVQSVTALMQQAASHAELQPHRPLPALATTFAATQVQVLFCCISNIQASLWNTCLFLMELRLGLCYSYISAA